MIVKVSALQSRVWVILTTLLASTTVVQSEPTGRVTGTVTELGKHGCKDGIAGVEVSIVTENGDSTPQTMTNAAGAYVIDDVPVGSVEIEFKHLDYRPRPKRIEVNVEEQVPAQVNACLWNQTQDAAFYTGVGRHFVQAARNTESSDEMYRKQWSKLLEFGVSPTSKVFVYQSMAKIDPSVVMAVPQIRGYLATSPETVLRAYTEFQRALARSEEAPSPATCKIPEDVAVDVVGHLLKKQAQSDYGKGRFFNSFRAKWGDEAAKRVRDLSIERAEYQGGTEKMLPISGHPVKG